MDEKVRDKLQSLRSILWIFLTFVRPQAVSDPAKHASGPAERLEHGTLELKSLNASVLPHGKNPDRQRSRAEVHRPSN